jgi:hypothetical protein
VFVRTTSTTTNASGKMAPRGVQQRGSGRTRGLEVFIQQELWKNFEGWLYYTLSFSQLATAGALTRSPYDQTNVLGVVLAYTLPRGFHLRGRFQYATGFPTTATTGGIFNSSTDSYSTTTGPTLAARTPDFSQLDLRVDKTWTFQRWRMSAYLDVRNVYNRANVVTPYVSNYDSSQRYARSGLPILPMFGTRLDF